MEQNEFNCPKCGCTHTTRIPAELIDSDTRKLWWITTVFLLLGITINPIILLLVIFTAVLSVIIALIGKLRSRSVWDMQCSRCGCEFSIPNPDIEIRKEKKRIEQAKRADARLVKLKRQLEDKEYNGQLLDDELPLGKISSIGYRKNVFTSVLYDVKCTNRGLIVYNAKSSFRIPSSAILSICKKNYLFFIPTGIQITAKNAKGKPQHYCFVTVPAERESVIATLSAALSTAKNV